MPPAARTCPAAIDALEQARDIRRFGPMTAEARESACNALRESAAARMDEAMARLAVGCRA